MLSVSLTQKVSLFQNANIDDTTTVLETEITMPTATKLQDVTTAPDYHLIPTGKVDAIAPGSAWDFTKPKALGKDINKGNVDPKGGYDNAWIFDDWKPGMAARHVLTARSALTGITLEMSTDQPSVQIYTGNFLNGTDTNSSASDTRIHRKASQGGPDKYYHVSHTALSCSRFASRLSQNSRTDWCGVPSGAGRSRWRRSSTLTLRTTRASPRSSCTRGSATSSTPPTD